MRLIYIAVLIIGSLTLTRCATSSNDSSSDISDAASEVSADQNSGDQNAVAPNETSEADLQGDQQAQSQIPQDQPPEDTAQVPTDNIAPPPEAGADAQNMMPPPSTEGTSKVTALDYKSNLNGGTVVVRTNNAVTYQTRKNAETNQFIVELDNTTLPKKFRRPYETKEFGGPIASLSAYQAKNANSTRIVVQLRDGAGEPSVVQDGNVISIVGAGEGGQVAQAPAAPAPDTTGETEVAPGEAAVDEQAANADSESNLKIESNDVLSGNNKFYGRRISLEVKDSDIKDVFRFLADESGLNIVLSEDVSGKVSLKLKRIPWDQALMVVMQSKNLGYVKQGNILRIAPLSKLQDESNQARSVLEAQKLLQPLRVQLFPVGYAKAEDMEAQAKEFLSPRGKAKADKRTNTLVVTDIDEHIQKVKELIHRLDTETPQVLIEAKIVEARETFSRLIGISWGNANADGSVLGFRTPATPGGPPRPITATPTFSLPNSGNGTNFLNLAVGTFDVFGDLSASLKLLETENQVKVLSSPRIVTTDRVKASIEQTTQFPIFSAITSTVNGVTTTTSAITFQDVKLQLGVTPQITNGGGIIMDVNILREFADAQVEFGTSVARPVNKRSAVTQVLVENGDTAVIGGIYQSDATTGESGVPWLRKIPLLGWLFQSKSVDKSKNELVIFLTPRVLNKDRAFVKASNDVQQ